MTEIEIDKSMLAKKLISLYGADVEFLAVSESLADKIEKYCGNDDFANDYPEQFDEMTEDIMKIILNATVNITLKDED